MSKILLIGGGGFIGTNLAKKLLKKNHSVSIYDSFIEQVHGKLSAKEYLKQFNKKPLIYPYDVLNKKSLSKVLSNKFDIIYYLVSETGTVQSMEEISRYSNTNVQGCAVFWECLIKSQNFPKTIYLTSSRAVYGEGGGLSHFLYPISFYGLNKMMQEQFFFFFGKLLNIPITVFRFQNIYGPGQSKNNPYTGVLNFFIKQAINNKDIEIFDNGKITRDFIYIDDLTDFLLENLKNDNKNTIINVGSGNKIKLLEVAELIIKLTKSKSKIIITDKHRKGDVIYACSPDSIATKVSLELGLQKLIRYIKNE